MPLPWRASVQHMIYVPMALSFFWGRKGILLVSTMPQVVTQLHGKSIAVMPQSFGFDSRQHKIV